ncbi:TraR/DksA family transcriptional regulator [Nocardioides piscis]|uniref:TraR/DksA family transcriptional regulator n=1 Tax=Nocardioides piscis TaxID=2714938 RepID=UPI001981B36E|nr:TraR/DksA C4-type zinc finger protein [Nocardioides piscis]
MPSDVDAHLARLEAARQAQLATLPQSPVDVVAAAHRGAVVRILEQVRAARQRLRAGTYGECAKCGTWIEPARLELRPWLVTCTACAEG